MMASTKSIDPEAETVATGNPVVAAVVEVMDIGDVVDSEVTDVVEGEVTHVAEPVDVARTNPEVIHIQLLQLRHGEVCALVSSFGSSPCLFCGINGELV
jgi:hypothetical protein